MPDDHLERRDLAIEALEPNPQNPNEMSAQQFNNLYANMETVGLTDPILVRPHPDKAGQYRIIGGEHRWEVAKLMGYESVPCTILLDEDFSDDDEAFQMVRHNVIKGRLSPQKFMKLYESLSEDYTEAVAAEMFGFESEEEFRKLIQTTKDSLPPDMQPQFEQAAKDIQTIDDLSRVLNELFATHGDTLPHAYMIVDFGGQDSIWLRMKKNQKDHFLDLAHRCKAQNRSMDHVMAELLQTLYRGEPVDLDALIAACPEVPGAAQSETPTLDFLDQQL